MPLKFKIIIQSQFSVAQISAHTSSSVYLRCPNQPARVFQPVWPRTVTCLSANTLTHPHELQVQNCTHHYTNTNPTDIPTNTFDQPDLLKHSEDSGLHFTRVKAENYKELLQDS